MDFNELSYIDVGFDDVTWNKSTKREFLSFKNAANDVAQVSTLLAAGCCAAMQVLSRAQQYVPTFHFVEVDEFDSPAEKQVDQTSLAY